MEREDEVNTIRKEHSEILQPEDPEQVALRARSEEIYRRQLRPKGWKRLWRGKLKKEFTLWNPAGRRRGHKNAVLGEDFFFDAEDALQYVQVKEALQYVQDKEAQHAQAQVEAQLLPQHSASAEAGLQMSLHSMQG
jgi:hypothetical protein